MANEQQKKKAEDFRKQQSGEQNASPDEALAATSSSNEESSSISQDDDFATTTTSSSPEKSSAQTTMDEAIGLAAACTSVKLNDLVADLCITSSTSAGASSNSQPAAALRSQVVPPVNNASSGSSSYGDYTNIRATTTLKASATRLNDMSTCVADSSTESCSSAAPPPTQQQPAAAPVQNSSSSFSFKHFLNSSNSVTAPSTTVTSLDPIGSGGSTATATTTSVATTGSATSSTTVMTSTVPTSTSTTTSSSSSLSFQSSTGARPKVPQSASVSGSMMQHTSSSNTLCADISTSSSKMKRSPRFSSFDSQASLAEYAGAPLDGFISCSQTLGGHNRRGGTADLDADGAEDYFSSSHYSSMRGPAASSSDCPLDFDTRQGVPRSLTNFDFQTSSSPRRRVGANQSRRPTRLALNYASGGGGMVTSTSSSSSSKMKLDLPFENAATNYAAAPSTSAAAASLAAASMSPSSSGGAAGGLPAAASSSRQSLGGGGGGLGDYQPAAAAALPDFVQDHWLDSWYAHDAHLSSPPNSPIHEFVDDIGVVGAAGGHAEAAVAAACLNSNEALALGGAGVGLNLSVSGVGGVVGSSSNGSQVSSAAAANESATVGSKMLPDFLSDGPIIHSSQRLADVAVGLPSNSMGSPDDSHLATQLSRLLSENEHLHREVSDMRSALQEQTRRANDLERMLQEQQRREQVKANEQQQQQMYGGKLTSDEMILMQLQMANMRGEIERLRYENALLREEGAVGGAPADSPVNHRPTKASTAGATSTGAAGAAAASSANSSAAGSGGASTSAGARNNSARPSKTQQQQQQHLQNQNLSRDLRLAATTAETHLRQLLAGVDNLRQMATQIDSGDCALDYNVSPDLFTDYPVQCFDYDEYAGTTS